MDAKTQFFDCIKALKWSIMAKVATGKCSEQKVILKHSRKW